MSQASATKLIPKLRFKVHDRRRLSNPEGPLGRHNKIKKTVTALFKYERLEMNYHSADESRGYAERLIADAIRYGDTHKPTMELASYWIVEKPIIHKLFKVLAPRYKDITTSYTKLWRAPNVYHKTLYPKCVLELRGNIYPPLGENDSNKKNLIHNILLEEAKKAYRQEKNLKAEGKTSQDESEGKVPCENHPNVKDNAVVAADVESSKLSETFMEKNLVTEDNLEAESNSESEIREKNDAASSDLKEDLDLNKIKITEEKPVETSSTEQKN